MASVTLQKSGYWQGKLQVDGRRVSVYGKTEAEAKRKLATLQKAAIKQGGLPDNCTLQELLDRWLEAESPKWKPRTLHDYHKLVATVIGPNLGSVRLPKLTPDRIQAFYTRVGRTNSRHPSYCHAILHRALHVGVMWGVIPGNPADRVSRPVQRPEKPLLWTPTQVRQFLTASADHWLGPLFTVALHTGCRPGELTALRWSDLDLEQGTVKVQRTAQRLNGQWVESSPKTASGTRVLTISPVVASAFRRQRAWQNTRRIALGERWNGGDHIFTSYGGELLSNSCVGHALHWIADKEGLPRIGPHKLRHLSASLALQNGVPLTMVSRRLGHAGVQITAMVYSHLLTDDRQAADVLAKVLG